MCGDSMWKMSETWTQSIYTYFRQVILRFISHMILYHYAKFELVWLSCFWVIQKIVQLQKSFERFCPSLYIWIGYRTNTALAPGPAWLGHWRRVVFESPVPRLQKNRNQTRPDHFRTTIPRTAKNQDYSPVFSPSQLWKSTDWSKTGHDRSLCVVTH